MATIEQVRDAGVLAQAALEDYVELAGRYVDPRTGQRLVSDVHLWEARHVETCLRYVNERLARTGSPKHHDETEEETNR